MKRALFLSFMVSLVSIANAGLHLDYANQAMSVYSDEPLVGGIQCFIGMRGPSQIFSWDNPTFRTSGAPLSQPEFTSFSPQEIFDSGLDYNLGLLYIGWGDAINTPNPAGFWCSPVRSDIPPMPIDFYIWRADLLVNDDSGLYVIDHLNFVPEPCTLLLLGLGGLLIRHRKTRKSF